ncbi:MULTISPECIES: hypothetical protein [unclassified Coleofasciculus]|nr:MULTISPECIES: hypothetical protein [unclassified Coleofasciculus]
MLCKKEGNLFKPIAQPHYFPNGEKFSLQTALIVPFAKTDSQ